MRIALVTGGLSFGGSTTFTLYLASGLRDSGIPAEVFSLTADNPHRSEFEAAAVPVHHQDEKRLIFEDRLRNAYRIVREFAPTVIITIIGTEAYEFLRYVPIGVSRIGIVHDTGMMPAELIPRYRHVLDHVVVVGEYLLEGIRRVIPDIPLTYVPHGIPLPSKRRVSPIGCKGPLRLLYYGRLVQRPKRVRIFPEIIRALSERRVPFTWTIHGTGPDEHFLRKSLSSEIASGRVRISSPVASAALAKMIQGNDIYILASFEEGGPLTLLEAMAFGLVPVCADIPGLVRDVITEDNGFRVAGGDPEAYADALARLHNDRLLLEKMSASALRVVTSDFSQEAMASRYVRLIESLPGNGQSCFWPQNIDPKPIIGSSKRILFSPLGRLARRMNRRLRLFGNPKQ